MKLRHELRGRILHPFPQEPSRPPRVEVGILDNGEALTERLEGIPADSFSVAGRGQAFAGNGLGGPTRSPS